MIYPGGFIEQSDLRPSALGGRYDLVTTINDIDYVVATARFWDGDVVNPSSLVTTVPHNADILSYKMERRSRRNYFYTRLSLDTAYHLGCGHTNTNIASEEDIIARLQSEWAVYSMRTIELLNTFFWLRPEQFSRRSQRAAFIKQHTDVKFEYCKHSQYYVPADLKIRKWDDVSNTFIRCWYGYNNRSIITYRTRLIDILVPQTHQRDYTAPHELMRYNARATDFFDFLRKDDKSDMFFGLELEYEGATPSIISDTKQLLANYAIVKRDGSLANGLEVCTAPAHFEIHKEKLETFFKGKNPALYRSGNTGMHVHMSKEPMSFLQLGKLFALLNNPENEEMLIAIAGRRANTYCAPRQPANLEELFSYGHTHGHHLSRYSRVNLTNNSTVEIRMFATPVEYKEAMSSLEFCKAAVDFTNPCSGVAIKDSASAEKFTNFVRSNRKTFPNLFNVMGASV